MPHSLNGPVLVTGASGFVGGAVARRLLNGGRCVRALSRSPMPELERLGAEIIQADVADERAMRAACQDMETVFHAAARVGIWGPRAEFERTNIGGARVITDACRTSGVRRLVFTSSPSVVFNSSDMAGISESQPPDVNFLADYPRTKAEAERTILSAHQPGRLATIALRPHLVWGVGDRQLIPKVIARARAGRLRIVGHGRNRIDLTHIENVVDAHLLAEAALSQDASPTGGRAYFITNGEPVILWDWVNELLEKLKIPRVRRQISLERARRTGAVCELLWRIFHLHGEPPMTRFLATELAKDHWFNIDAARRDLGYQPRVSMDQGLRELIPWLRENL